MAKTVNTKIVLCFKEGEPYLYNKEKKKYIAFCFVKDKIVANVKQTLTEMNLKKRPPMREIWQILASMIPHCDGFCNNFSIKTSSLSENCFENFFSREISNFLNNFFPIEDVDKYNELRRKYEKNFFCNKSNFSETAKKHEKRIQMEKKAGRKIYH